VLLTGGNYTYPQESGVILQSTLPLLGVNPPPPEKKTPFRPDVPCETQEQPDLHSVPADVPGREHKVTVTDKAGYQKVVDRAGEAIKGNTPKNGPGKDKSVLDSALDAVKAMGK
jgi:hypothetical protein